MSFLMHHWRPGVRGAFRMGVDHGAYCLGCCWALMALLFVGGVMNLAVIAALTVLVGFEKLGPFGVRTAWATGALLIGAGVWMLLAALIADRGLPQLPPPADGRKAEPWASGPVGAR